MIKTLSQNGLNFIANKYKELRTALSNKVDKIDGKSLSTNDYDNTAKSKVDAIPANPKYTDTVTSVVDNLTTDDATKALSAKQGKALQDNKVGWSDFGSGRTAGLPGVITWGNVTESKPLNAWIGDFDTRTRELKNSKGLTGNDSEIKTQKIECDNVSNTTLLAIKWGRIVQLYFYSQYDANSPNVYAWQYTIPKEFIPAVHQYGMIVNGHWDIYPQNDKSNAQLTVYNAKKQTQDRICGTITYVARY